MSFEGQVVDIVNENCWTTIEVKGQSQSHLVEHCYCGLGEKLDSVFIGDYVKKNKGSMVLYDKTTGVNYVINYCDH